MVFLRDCLWFLWWLCSPLAEGYLALGLAVGFLGRYGNFRLGARAGDVFAHQFWDSSLWRCRTSFSTLAGYLVTLASAYRLARFNIDTRQHDSFIGLPTPANALFILTVGYMVQKAQYISALPLWVALLITLVSCYLLNSNLPLFSLKFKDFSLKKNAIKYIFLLLSLVLLLCFQINAFALIILAYILLSIGSNLFKNKDKNETI